MRIVQHTYVWIGTAAVAGLFVLLLPVVRNGQTPEQAEPAGGNPQLNRSLKILYAGHSGSNREKDFVGFLRQHFDVVQTADLKAFAQSGFAEKDAEGFDVTIFDYDGDGREAPQSAVRPRFPDEWPGNSRGTTGPWLTRPLITVGVAGGQMCQQWKLKTGYL
jgi:hypothetical protein